MLIYNIFKSLLLFKLILLIRQEEKEDLINKRTLRQLSIPQPNFQSLDNFHPHHPGVEPNRYDQGGSIIDWNGSVKSWNPSYPHLQHQHQFHQPQQLHQPYYQPHQQLQQQTQIFQSYPMQHFQ